MKKLHAEVLLIICLFVGLLCAGCTGGEDTQVASEHQLNLDSPAVKGMQVTVNGGVAVPVERIQWDWGDGQMDKHHFFPATHTYSKPGKYQITVTVFDLQNRYSSKSVTVELK